MNKQVSDAENSSATNLGTNQIASDNFEYPETSIQYSIATPDVAKLDTATESSQDYIGALPTRLFHVGEYVSFESSKNDLKDFVRLESNPLKNEICFEYVARILELQQDRMLVKIKMASSVHEDAIFKDFYGPSQYDQVCWLVTDIGSLRRIKLRKLYLSTVDTILTALERKRLQIDEKLHQARGKPFPEQLDFDDLAHELLFKDANLEYQQQFYSKIYFPFIHDLLYPDIPEPLADIIITYLHYSPNCVYRSAYLPILSEEPSRMNINASKIGGSPFLLRNESWPVCSRQHTMHFFLQLRIQDLPLPVQNNFFRSSASAQMIQLFACLDSGCSGDYKDTSSACAYCVRLLEMTDGEDVDEYSLTYQDSQSLYKEQTIVGWVEQRDYPEFSDYDLYAIPEDKPWMKEEYSPIISFKLGGFRAFSTYSYVKCRLCDKAMCCIFQVASGEFGQLLWTYRGTGAIFQCTNPIHSPVLVFIKGSHEF